jgi:hypothetical protein
MNASSSLASAAADARTLEHAARRTARTPQGAAAALALALGKLCADEGIDARALTEVVHAAHDAAKDVRRHDA